MSRCHRAGDNVDLGLQAYTGHADRILDSGFIIHDVFLWQHMDNFTVHGDGYGPGRINDAIYIIIGNFGSLDGNDAATVESRYVAAGDAGIDRRYFTAGHEFGLFDCFFNGFHSGFDIDHNSLAQPD